MTRPLAWLTIVCFCLVNHNGPTGPAIAQERTPQDRRVDEAISRSLVFLQSQQRTSGAWAIDSLGESTAATSLAVMSFLAAGYTPGDPLYGETINRGVDWVLDHQEDNGFLVHRRSHGPMYSHGISTLMLSEVIGMLDANRSDRCRQALQRAVRLILSAQDVTKSDRHAGGWRYSPTSEDSDLSVTAWQVLALRAAKSSGCDIDAGHIARAVDYVRRCQSPGEGFGYQPGGGPTSTRTGTGILALEICGEHHSKEALAAADYLLDHPLNSDDYYFFYGVYYCSVGMFKIGGKHWDEGKEHIFGILLNTQNDDGSWTAIKGTERNQGQVYATSLAVLALAIEYRYLPIYQR